MERYSYNEILKMLGLIDSPLSKKIFEIYLDSLRESLDKSEQNYRAEEKLISTALFFTFIRYQNH